MTDTAKQTRSGGAPIEARKLASLDSVVTGGSRAFGAGRAVCVVSLDVSHFPLGRCASTTSSRRRSRCLPGTSCVIKHRQDYNVSRVAPRARASEARGAVDT
ncbi:hypothetical protein MRX96_015831 [Rhipicephalus microplus]